jgi:hypothetical protein
MEESLSEPVDLIESHLDEVAGGSFGNLSLAAVTPRQSLMLASMSARSLAQMFD